MNIYDTVILEAVCTNCNHAPLVEWSVQMQDRNVSQFQNYPLLVFHPNAFRPLSSSMSISLSGMILKKKMFYRKKTLRSFF